MLSMPFLLIVSCNIASAVFSVIRGANAKKTINTFIILSNPLSKPLISFIVLAPYESCVEKTGHLKRSSNRANFSLLRKTESALASQTACY